MGFFQQCWRFGNSLTSLKVGRYFDKTGLSANDFADNEMALRYHKMDLMIFQYQQKSAVIFSNSVNGVITGLHYTI